MRERTEKNKVAKVVLKLSFQNSYKEWPATSVIFTVVLTQGQGKSLLTRMWCSTLTLSKVKNSEPEKGWPSSRDVTRGWIQQGQRESQSHTVEATKEQHKSHSWMYRNSAGWAAREDAIHNTSRAPEGTERKCLENGCVLGLLW